MNRSLEMRLRWLLLAGLVVTCLLAVRSDSRPAISSGLHPMPPHPAMVDSPLWVNQEPPDLSDKLSKGIDTPEYILHPPSGDFNLLVVLVQFSDKKGQYGLFNEFDDLFFNTLNYDSVADYFLEISFNSLSITTVDLPSSTSWITATLPYNGSTGYVNDDQQTGTGDDFGWGAYPQNLQGIVADIIPLLEDDDGIDIDYSQYDNDGDGFVDGVVFVHAGAAAELSLNPNDIWSAAWDMSSGNGPGPIITEDGVYVDNFVFGPEYLVNPGDVTIGVFTHELGHALFGLPDLYDLDLSSYGVGNWSLMSYGAWNGGDLIYVPGPGWVSSGDSPAWPDAWSRTRMGFESTQTIPQNIRGFEFLPVENNPGNVVRLWTPNLGDEEYFLVEYRDQVGYDTNLPGSGLLIWHVDEAKWNRWGLNQVECESSPCCACEDGHPLLALAQADGELELESLENWGDVDDPFPGPDNNTSFDFESTPESGSYYADTCPADSCIGVEIDIASNEIITANMNVVCRVQGACVNILTDRVLLWREAGKEAVYEASIQNCGNADDTLTLSYESAWLAEFFTLEKGEMITTTENVVPAGAAWEVGISVTVPSEALWNAMDVLSLTVTSANDVGISTTVQLTTTVPYCTLVVDDDRGAPDVEAAYIDSLTNAGFDFDLWDTQVSGSPDEDTLAAHKAVVWFTGTPISNTLTPHDELAVSTYLQEGGGGFFLSSQEYLTDTLRDYFGHQYLRVSTFRDNAGVQVVSGVPGNPLSDGLGPYTMSITTTLSDQVMPLSATLSAFTDEGGITNAITYDPGAWRTLFLGWPFEHLAQADGEELMASTLSWFEVPPRPLVSYEPSALVVCEGQAIAFTNTSSYASAYMWSFGDGVTSTLTSTVHVYSDPMTATVTLTGTNCCGFAAVTETITVYDTPLVEFTPSAELIFPYQPVTFTLLSPETAELTYTWDFGDGTGEFREANPDHKYSESGWYTVTLRTSDENCTGVTSIQIYVSTPIYLPLTLNQPDWRAVQPDAWEGNFRFDLVAVSTISLGLIVKNPFKRR